MATLQVTVGGTEPVSIQWYADDVVIPGATGTVLRGTLPGVQYYVVASNACGTATSAKVYGDGTPVEV